MRLEAEGEVEWKIDNLWSLLVCCGGVEWRAPCSGGTPLHSTPLHTSLEMFYPAKVDSRQESQNKTLLPDLLPEITTCLNWQARRTVRSPHPNYGLIISCKRVIWLHCFKLFQDPI